MIFLHFFVLNCSTDCESRVTKVGSFSYHLRSKWLPRSSNPTLELLFLKCWHHRITTIIAYLKEKQNQYTSFSVPAVFVSSSEFLPSLSCEDFLFFPTQQLSFVVFPIKIKRTLFSMNLTYYKILSKMNNSVATVFFSCLFRF